MKLRSLWLEGRRSVVERGNWISWGRWGRIIRCRCFEGAVACLLREGERGTKGIGLMNDEFVTITKEAPKRMAVLHDYRSDTNRDSMKILFSAIKPATAALVEAIELLYLYKSFKSLYMCKHLLGLP